jgi:hypothetical protein
MAAKNDAKDAKKGLSGGETRMTEAIPHIKTKTNDNATLSVVFFRRQMRRLLAKILAKSAAAIHPRR